MQIPNLSIPRVDMKNCFPLLTLSIAATLASATRAADPVPLGPPFVATSDTPHVQGEPRVSCDDDGHFVYVYSRGEIYARRYGLDGTPLSNDVQANPTKVHGTQDEAWVSLDPITGDYAVAWSDRNGGDGFEMGIGGRFFAADGTPYGAEFFLNVHTDFSQFDPRISFARTGRVVVAWTDAGADGSAGAFARIFERDGTPVTGEILLNHPSTFTQIQPDIACDRDGNFVAAYVDASGAYGEPRQILGRLFDADGLALGPEFVVNDVPDGMQRYPSVASGANGDFVVAWHDQSGTDGDGFGVFARCFAADGTPKGTQFVLSNTTAGDQQIPIVACDWVGNFVAVWEDWSGADADVMGRRFDVDGAPLGAEFTLHAPAEAGHQSWATVALSQSGQRIVTSWFDSDTDAYARLFEVPVFTTSPSLSLGTSSTFTLDVPGVGGDSYLFLPSLATSGIAVAGGRTLGLAFDPLLLFAASFPESTLFSGLAGKLDSSGGGTATFHVPSDAVVQGVAVSFALLTWDGQPDGVDFVSDSETYVIQ